jgi:hypothetical protein
VAEIEDWQGRFLAAAENALRSRPKDEEALKNEQISTPSAAASTSTRPA